ncbi:MAG: SIMPL domain-containing protein [Actinomycetota bacterium]|nr:SIMPL domain-containing protein [Actinomycetota bacterium]
MAEPTYVEVTGNGAATVTPDRLRVHLAAESRAASVAEAFEGADTALRAMLAALRRHGATDEDLRSTAIEVYPRNDRREARGQRGFQASMGVEAQLRDLSTAGAALSAALEAGGDASRVHGVSLATSTTEEALTEAREEAWANAAAKAQQYAELAGRPLGVVLSVSELSSRGGWPVEASGGQAVAFSAAAVEPGSSRLHAAVAVRWELV